MVQSDRQGPIRDDAEGGLRGSGGQQGRGWGGSCLGRTLRERQGRKSAAPERGTASGKLPAATNPTALHPQAGEYRDAPTGNTNGTRPGGTDGAAHGD